MSTQGPDDEPIDAPVGDIFDNAASYEGTGSAYGADVSTLSVALGERRNRRRRAAVMVGAIGLPALLLAGSLAGRPAMENELEDKVSLALTSKGISGVEVLANGLTVNLSGFVTSAADKELALKTADHVRGVRSARGGALSVRTGSTTAAPAVNILPLIATYSEGSVSFAGTRPSPQAVKVLLEAARQGLGAKQVTDGLTVKGSESVAVDVDGYQRLGTAIANFDRLKVRTAALNVRNGSIDASGILGDDTRRADVMALLAGVVGDPNRIRDTFTAEAAVSAAGTAQTATTSAGATPTSSTPGAAGPATTATGATTGAPTTVLASADAQIAINAILKRGKITFATNLATLLPTGRKLVDSIGEVMTGTALHIDVTGYTDNRGDAAKNVALSQERADAVKAALVTKGVPESQITATGRGSANPVDSNASAAGQARNRRIEFLVRP